MANSKSIFLGATIIVASLIIAGSFFYFSQGKKCSQIEKGFLNAQAAAQKAIDFLNQNKKAFGLSADSNFELISVNEENGLYKFHYKLSQGGQEEEYDSYVTKDGKIFFSSGLDMETISAQVKETQKSQEVTKSDQPDVKLFVMSYCPYGLQMEKAFLPVYDLLKNKAQMGIYFVNYIMHGKQELDENLRQYCIQKEQKEKYPDYLTCFIKEGKFEECLAEAKIDKKKLSDCVSKTDQEFKITQNYNDKSTWISGYYPKFDIHSDLNQKYGVQGSPTLVINEKIVSVSRSPQAVKDAICQAFNSPPPECEKELSNTEFSPGFGWATGNTSGSGQCQ